jgi:hypothetical protein
VDAPAQGGGFLGGPIGKYFNLGPPVAAGCCCRYELKPPFLLDNTTGDVWMYDEHTKRFQKVEVDRHPIAKAIENLVNAKAAIELHAKLETDGVVVNRVQYAKLAPFVDQTLKAIDTRLEEMRRT